MTDNRPWVERALCADSPEPDAWFADRPEDIAYAISVCRRCPVRIQCLDAALTNHERYGVFGGVCMGRDGVKTENLTIRIWAAQQGTPLPHTGRMSSEVVRAYRKATA